MRFQTTETVPTGDVEHVLHALELSLREFSEGVERNGYQIVLYGLGPSPKTINYRDTAIFEVVSYKGTTTIHADVSFQASGLLGTSAQDLVVQGKLNSLFEQMRTRLSLTATEKVAPSRTRPVLHEEPLSVEVEERVAESQVENEAARAEQSASMVPPDSGLTYLERGDRSEEVGELGRFWRSGRSIYSRAEAAMHRREPAGEPVESFPVEEPVAPVVEAQVKEEAPVVAVQVAVPEPVAEPSLEAPVIEAVPEKILEPDSVVSVDEVAAEVETPPTVKEEFVAEAPRAVEASAAVSTGSVGAAAVAREASGASSARSTVFGQLASRLDSGIRGRASLEREKAEAPALQLGAAGVAHKTGVPVLIAILVAIIAAAASVYLYWSGQFNLQFAERMISPPAPVPAAPAPAELPVVTPPTSEPPPRHEELNPKLWVEEWADALRGRDPELQASFYADPVAHYQDDLNVSKDALTTGFRSAIQARDGLWTLKLENVSVTPKSSDDVIVWLTKHYMQLNDAANGIAAQIADRYVRSRLELKKIDGEWKIVSEQDQASPGGF